MSEVKDLSRYLKFLQIFGFQFFSLNHLNFKSELKFASKNFKLLFVLHISFLFITTSYLWLYYFKNFQNISIEGNVLGYIFKLVAAILSTTRSLNSISEAFLKVKSNQKFFVIFNDFCEHFKDNFKAQVPLEKFRNVLKRRLIYLTVISVFYTTYDMLVLKSVPAYILVIQTLFLMAVFMTGYLLLYKFCFYIDLVFICLVKFDENLNDILTFGTENNELLTKIYQIKRSYIYILEMAEELNNFMFVTISTYTTTEFVWLLTRLYTLFQVISKGGKFEEVVAPILHATRDISDFIFMSVCCQNIDDIMDAITNKINYFDENVIASRSCQDSLRTLYDQIIVQPIEIHSFGIRKMNKLFFVGVLMSILSNIVLLISFEQ